MHQLPQVWPLLHEILLKTDEPIYVKQFRIPDAHHNEVEKHVTEWLKMGVVQPARSKYNSPIFAVAKKNGGIRLVQDFRALNAETHMDKYSMKDVSECIGEIRRSGSCLFTTTDLTRGFWQMLLQPKSRPYTAFTVPGKGQFQWVTSPMGPLGCPSLFQRLMETVVHGLQNIIVYIHNLLVHSSMHQMLQPQHYQTHGLLQQQPAQTRYVQHQPLQGPAQHQTQQSLKAPTLMVTTTDPSAPAPKVLNYSGPTEVVHTLEWT